MLILEHHLRSCDELHVARRDAQAAALAHSKKRRYRMACRANDVFARSSRPMERLDPPRGRTGAVSRPPAGVAPAAAAAAAPRLR